MSASIYKITCLTNLSVGSGEANFSVIDNEVEKDAATGLPMINASGLKGAFRQFFVEKENENTVQLFGSEPGANDMRPGDLKFIDAYMLAMPVRASQGNRAYYMTVPAAALDTFCDTAQLCGWSVSNDIVSSENHTGESTVGVDGIVVAGTAANDIDVLKCFGIEQYVVMSDQSFRDISLPVLARNYLENRKSKNLWYEEVVPHKSVFYFAVLGEQDNLETFNTAVNDKLVQFGGNASIGRGFCEVSRVWTTNA